MLFKPELTFKETNLNFRRFTEKDIKDEPMWFHASLDKLLAFDWKKCGSITKAFIDELTHNTDFCDNSEEIRIDSRSHMLMEGWYPAIPGWHHDDVPRTAPNKQPDYSSKTRTKHAMLVVNADVSPTEFITSDIEVHVPKFCSSNKPFYYEADFFLNADKTKKTICVRDNQMVFFDDRTFHRATPTLKNGWRFFIRATKCYNEDQTPCDYLNNLEHEIRKQSQVYIDPINKGW
jgi:hypothetical protein